MKKTLLWLLILIITVGMVTTFSLAGCKGEAGEGEEVTEAEETTEEATEEEATEEAPAEEAAEEKEPATIMYWTKEADPPSVEVWNQLIAEFQEMYPWITVELQVLNDIDDKLLTTSAAGGDIDVFEPNVNTIISFMNNDLLLPLNDVVDNLGGPEIYINDDAFSDPDGNIIAIPYCGGGFVWWIRKDMLEEKGIAIPDTDLTWAETLDMAEKLTDEDTYGVGIPASPHIATAYYFLMTSAWSNGISVFDEEGNVQFNHPRMVEGLKFYTDLAKFAPDDISEWAWFEVIDAFTSGRVAMIPCAGRPLSRIYNEAPDLKGKVMVTAIPHSENFISVAAKDFNQRCIYAETKYPEESKLLLEFLQRPENNVRFLATVPAHLLPSTEAETQAIKDMNLTELVENPEILEVILASPKTSWNEVFLGGIDFENKTVTIKDRPFNPYVALLYDGVAISNAIQSVLLTGQDPQAACDDAQALMESNVEQLKKELQ